MSAETPTPAPETPAKGSRRKLFMIAGPILLVALAGGGVAAYKAFAGKSETAPAAADELPDWLKPDEPVLAPKPSLSQRPRKKMTDWLNALPGATAPSEAASGEPGEPAAEAPTPPVAEAPAPSESAGEPPAPNQG